MLSNNFLSSMSKLRYKIHHTLWFFGYGSFEPLTWIEEEKLYQWFWTNETKLVVVLRIEFSSSKNEWKLILESSSELVKSILLQEKELSDFEYFLRQENEILLTEETINELSL